MRNASGRNLFLFPIPLISFVFCAFLALFINNSYSIDPDYAYLFNGLNFIRGESYAINHLDHPGTPLQVLIGLLIFTISTLRDADDLTTDVLSHPELYIKSIIISIAFLYSLVLFFIGSRYYKYQKNLLQTLLLQLSFLFFAAVTITPSKLFTETILPLGVFLIILLIIEKTWGKLSELKFSLLSGTIIGIFIAVKITFLPVAMVPLLVAVKWKNKLIIVLCVVLCFFISVLPVIDRIVLFKSFIQKIATHEGTYGSGMEETINFLKLFGNLWNILKAEYTFTLIFILTIFILAGYFVKNKMRFLKDNEIRILFGIFLVFFFQLIIVARHFGVRYMVPSLLLSGFALVMVLQHLQKSKILYYSSLISVLLLTTFYQFRMLSKAVRLHHVQNKTYSFVKSTITTNDPVIVISRESWYGSPFITHSLKFGKQYCLRGGEQYGPVLKSLYPAQYFWSHNNQQYCNWELAVMPDLLLNEYPVIYLYLQTDNPGLYKNALLDFTERLKYRSSKEVRLELAFSNPEIDEEIYRIRVDNRESPITKLDVFTDFEQISNNGRFLLTSHDSIYFDDAWRIVKKPVYHGEYSVCLKPENPFGISAPIPSVDQYDWIHLSVMCKRESARQECCFGIKSFVEKEGFVTLGGVPTQIFNGWEKIEYAYRFNHQPAGKKIVMFIWNNGNEPMYFDNLKIELFDCNTN